ncbi:MAG: acyltransferase [Alphaproteobacteria bacterium]|nr:acyltransferase [Alphaproteobacteria bacterium]
MSDPEETTASGKNLFLILQAWRGLAAAIVMISHANYEAWMISQKTGLAYTYIFYPSAAGVEIFFVISGFVIVYASRPLIGQTGSWKPFMLRRLIRIVPLYWFYTTLLLAVALILPKALDSAQPEFWHLVKSYLFIPHIRPAGDEAQPFLALGWTLNYEMYFYTVFAVLLFLPANRLMAVLSAYLAVSVIIGFFLPEGWTALQFWFKLYVLEFLAGAWMAFLYIRGFRLPNYTFWPLTAIGFTALLFLFTPHMDHGLRQGLMVLAALSLVAAATLPRGLEDIHPPRMFVALGDSSYSLYLCHPFVIGVMHIMFVKFGAGLGISLWLYLLLTLGISLAAGHVSYLLIEKTSKNFLQKRLIPKRPKS